MTIAVVALFANGCADPMDTAAYRVEKRCKPVLKALDEYYSANGRYPSTSTQLVASGYLTNWPSAGMQNHMGFEPIKYFCGYDGSFFAISCGFHLTNAFWLSGQSGWVWHTYESQERRWERGSVSLYSLNTEVAGRRYQEKKAREAALVVVKYLLLNGDFIHRVWSILGPGETGSVPSVARDVGDMALYYCTGTSDTGLCLVFNDRILTCLEGSEFVTRPRKALVAAYERMSVGDTQTWVRVEFEETPDPVVP